MADVTWEVKIWQSDGTAFSTANETGAEVRLRTSTSAGANTAEYTGNVANSGDFSETGNGLWSIAIDSGDSAWYLVQSQTTATGLWANVQGFAPIYIIRDDMLPSSGGTMSGAIVMGDNSITGIDTLTFTDTAGTVAGIQNGNLVDLAASETITGDWAHTGFVDITKDKLKIGGVAVTVTAAEANMLDGLTTTSKIMTMDTALGDRTTAKTSTATLTYTETGLVTADTTGGAFALTMPVLAAGNVGAKFAISFITDNGDLTILCSGADKFTFMTASGTETTGDTITMDTVDDCVMIEAVSANYWLIVGGVGVTIS